MQRKNLQTLVMLGCILFTPGCLNKVSNEIIIVTHEHKVLTEETCDALIASIDEHNNAGIPDDAKAANLQLKERLIAIKQQSVAIERYIHSKSTKKQLTTIFN